MDNSCFNCDRPGAVLYGFNICAECKKDLKLFTQETVERHMQTSSKSDYKKDVENKLSLLENVFKKKKIKLLDILKKIDK